MPIRGLLRKTDGSWDAPFVNMYFLRSESDYRGTPGPGVAAIFLSHDSPYSGKVDPQFAQMYLPFDDAVNLAVELLFQSDIARYKASGGDPEGGYTQEAADKRVLKLLTERLGAKPRA